MIICNTVHPKIYGLICTDSENIFVFAKKNVWPPVHGVWKLCKCWYKPKNVAFP